MKRILRTILTGTLLTFLSLSLYGQKGVETGTPFGRGEDSTRCLRNTSLYSTYYDNKDFPMAAAVLETGILRMPRIFKEHLYQGRGYVQGILPQVRQQGLY